MRFTGILFSRSFLIGAVVLCAVAGVVEIDPSDDLSFSLPALSAEAQRGMTVAEVSRILGDHLDLFPRASTPKLARHLLKLCNDYGFDPAFVLSLIEVESRFKVHALSPAGAVGLMQLMPDTALVVARQMTITQHYPSVQKALQSGNRSAFAQFLTDPFFNLELGVAYLSILRDRYRGLSPYYLVAAYNVGPARMDELLSRKSFRPVNTKRYYEDIRKRVPKFRFYQGPSRQGQGRQGWNRGAGAAL